MISSLDQRILYWNSANSTFTDYTIALNDPTNTQSVAFSMAAGDFIYLSSFLPFNHKYFKLKSGVATANGRSPKVEVNDSATWSPVVDILDYTGKLGASQVIQFTRDRDKTWSRISRSTTDVPVLVTAPVVYDSYWTRISFPGGGSNMTFTLEFIGQCFSTDTDLLEQYPALRSPKLLAGFDTSKTNWNDQHLLAASYLTKVLRQKKLVLTNDQILDIAVMRTPAVHKVAEIIYTGLGAKNYEKEIAAASAAFSRAMDMDQFQVDSDQDGLKGMADRGMTVSRATR